MSADDLPYRVEYAKTSRAACKNCKSKIDKEVLRIAVMVQSFRHDGKDPHWFHMSCFFLKHRPKSTDEIANFENIRYEDQGEIRKGLSSASVVVVAETEAPKGKKSKKRDAAAMEVKPVNAALSDYSIEYSKSSRATCVGCQNTITKGDVRVKKMIFDSEVARRFGGETKWHHLNCFASLRDTYGFYVGGELLSGFADLSADDKDSVINAIKPIKLDETQSKKIKTEDMLDEVLEETIKKQTERLFKIRDELKKHCDKNVLKRFLTHNGGGTIEGVDNLLDRCADFLAFGAIQKCQKCSNGDLVFSKHGYTCNGMVTEWAECLDFVEKPSRVECKIPDELAKVVSKFFPNFQAKIEDRAIRVKVVKEIDEKTKVVKIDRQREPLSNMHVVIVGKLVASNDELKRRIERMGGKLVTKLQSKIAFILSTEAEVAKMSKRMQEVKDLDIQVVGEDFLTVIDKGSQSDTIEKIKSMAICDWGSDPLSRIPQEEVKGPKESVYTRNINKVASVMVKDGSAVDPQSGLTNVAHVYRKDGALCNAVLSLIDITKNKNSFFKMQVLKDDSAYNFYLFRSWGRIGTNVGNFKLDTFNNSEDQALISFGKHFHEKTGNEFGTSPFVKIAGKYFPVEVDYDDGKKAAETLDPVEVIESKLPQQTQDLIKLLFDIDQMKLTMKELNLDLEKMPLGRLSKKQLHEAYTVLTELNDLITRGASNTEFIGLSNKFFTLIPHSFGMNKAPVVNTLEMIKDKREILDNLIEMELAFSMLQQDTDKNVSSIDSHYELLKTQLEPLDHDSEEFSLISQYVKNTHAATHNQYALKVLDVFKVDRQGEKLRYKPFKKLHNRKLLWHGSRLTNFVGILSHGLKIAPPEAPSTGYMFGKGIYFADMVSKSANYCCTHQSNDIGLMLLSEVALGDMYELTNAEMVTKLPHGKHSTKGIGRTAPDPKKSHKREDGVEIPIGSPVDVNNRNASLCYNEYIVYDVAQVNVQYLLKMKFDYDRRW